MRTANMPSRRMLIFWSALVQGLAGCASLAPIEGIPANRLPYALRAASKDDLETIDFVRLRQDPPPVYLLGPHDVLGVFIEGVLGTPEDLPPVHFSEKGLPPSIGFPIPVREDGTLPLPLVSPINVKDMSVAKAEEAIRRAYTIDRKILKQDKDRIIVTLMRKRTAKVIVVREDGGTALNNASSAGSGTAAVADRIKRGAGYNLDLEAYENDVLHALMATGGLPGGDAKNEIYVYRGKFADGVGRDALFRQMNSNGCDPCACIPRDKDLNKLNDPNVIRIPIRYDINDPPSFDQASVILQTGDIVVIESRDREVFYAGGVLKGGEYQLPRDRDLDLLGAISLTGGSVIGAGQSGGRQGGMPTISPSEVIIVRQLPCGGSIPIKTNLRRAITNSRDRIVIQPGDLIILRYTTGEILANAFLSTFQFNVFLNQLQR